METSIPVTQDAPSPRMTERLRPDADGVALAAELLREGGLVALPTETVYGLAADATSGTAVAGIYAAKERPSFNPLIAHLPDLAAARRQGLFDANALALARAFWPGPLTLVVPVSAGCEVSELARAGLASVALRVPSHPVAHAILQAAGRPIAAPSANRSGRVSATSAAHVLEDLDGRIVAQRTHRLHQFAGRAEISSYIGLIASSLARQAGDMLTVNGLLQPDLPSAIAQNTRRSLCEQAGGEAASRRVIGQNRSRHGN